MNHDAESIFNTARQLPIDERSRYLDQACGDDTALRQQLEELINANADVGSFLKTAPLRADDPTAFQAPSHRAQAELKADSIDGYKLLECIGEGGFGSVWMAEQREPVRRRVAIKIIKLGMDTKQIIARFEAERQALALMDHPHIASVYDAGATQQHRPYFTMEYVVGDAITAFADAHKLTITDRLRLFGQVCSAVQHAHTKGIIHRDIKPANILVSMVDGKPFAKVIDFGIAKATAGPLTDKTLFTAHRQLIGTPQYMSPEQAEGSADIDTRTDVYALGVLLYELLTGHTPFDGARLRSAAWGEMQRIIREEEPPAPSLRLSRELDHLAQTAAARRADPSRISAMIRGELDWVVMKALDKDRTRRYDTPSALAADLERHLAGDAVLAAPPSRVYRVRKFVLRNKGLVMASSLVAAVLLVGIVGTSLGLWRAGLANSAKDVALSSESQQRQLAEQKTLEAQDNLTLAQEQEQKANAARDDAEQQKQQAEKATHEARRQSYVASIRGAQASIQANDVSNAKYMLEAAPTELRNWEWKNLHSQLDQSLLVIPGHESAVSSVAFSPDGSRIVSAENTRGGESAVLLWDASTGKQLAALQGHKGRIGSVALSPDGSRIAATENTRGGESAVLLWDASSGELLRMLGGHEGRAFSVAFSPDGSRIVTGLDDNTVRVWDADTGKELAVLRGHEDDVWSVAFSPDGSRIVSGGMDGAVRVWDATSGKELAVLRGHEGFVTAVAFSPDGSRIASAGNDGTVRLWDASNLQKLAVLRGHEGWVNSIAFSPDGLRIVSGGSDKTVRVWDTDTGEQLVVLRGHEGGVISVAFSPDGSRIASGSWDKTVRLWDASLPDKFDILRGHEEPINLVAFSPDGSRIASGSWDKTVRLWDAQTGEQLVVLHGHTNGVTSVAYSPDGSRIASASADHTVRLWDASTGEQLLIFRGHQADVISVAFSPDGTRIVSASWDETVRLWDAETGEPLFVLRGRWSDVTSVAFSPDGSRIVSASRNKTARIWDASTGELLVVFRGHEGGVNSAAFSPDGSRIVSASDDKTVRVWDAETGKQLLVLRGRVADVHSVAFSPDGSRIVSGSSDGTVRVWDAQTGAQLTVLRGHESNVMSVAFSPDGSRIASAGDDNTVQLWDSVAYRDRIAERDEALRAEQTMASFVDDLFSNGLDCAAVAQSIKADESLSDPLRHAAINLVLKRCSAIR